MFSLHRTIQVLTRYYLFLGAPAILPHVLTQAPTPSRTPYPSHQIMNGPQRLHSHVLFTCSKHWYTTVVFTIETFH